MRSTQEQCVFSRGGIPCQVNNYMVTNRGLVYLTVLGEFPLNRVALTIFAAGW
jgi:hypothetical protein